MHNLDFYFDCSSPWTYLAFENALIQFKNQPVTVRWKPILVGGLFNTVNPSVYANRSNPVPVKETYAQKDLADWARHVGIEIGSPPVFPVNSVKAMRGAFIALEQDCLVPYARAIFEAYWRDLKDISQDEVLRPIVASLGLDVFDFFVDITTERRKSQLRENTDELVRRGGFGSPTFFLDGEDMYFGNDRLQIIEKMIKN